MAEHLEHFGTPCDLPEPEYEPVICPECARELNVDLEELAECEQCGAEACERCLIYDNVWGVYFCKPPKSGESSYCKEKFYAEEEEN